MIDEKRKGEIALKDLLEREGIMINPDIIKKINRKGNKEVSALAKATGIPKHILDKIGKSFYEQLVREPVGRFIILELLREDFSSLLSGPESNCGFF